MEPRGLPEDSNTDANDLFGSSVAVSGDTVVVGAIGEASNATGVDGNQATTASPCWGRDVFMRSAGVWSHEAYLKARIPVREIGSG
jgi:hypothetical protein